MSTCYLCVNCPPTVYSLTLTLLIMKQANSLYQTFWFCLLIILSKGWGLVRNQITRKEFKYMTILLLFIYILTSTANIVEHTVLACLLYTSDAADE